MPTARKRKAPARTAKAPTACPVESYARDVVEGRVVAGKPVRLACARHLRDLADGHTRGLRFDREASERAIAFFGFLTLAEGQHAGKPFTLEPWQQFIIGSLFGWLGADGYRRFRTAYIEVGKGNGKTPMAAGIGLYGLVADGEEGAQIFAAAVTREQARILFTDAEKMVAASPSLAGRVQQTVNNLAVVATNSFFRPVSSEANALDGKRVHMALVDELHEHRTADVVDKMRAGTKGRTQPMAVEITNSGYDRHSVCRRHHEYSLSVLEDTIPNDSWFGYVCALDDGDDWTDERVWIKANPNLGVSITMKYLREQVAEAVGMPSKQNIVKRLNLCIWTEQADRWLDIAVWDACGTAPVAEAALIGRPCFGGLDLATTTDIAALALVFPPVYESDPYTALCRFWIPADNIRKRADRDRVPYDVWTREGLITATGGNVIDYDVIKADIGALASRYRITELAYDRWNATQLVTQLTDDGLLMVPFGQGFASMAAPTKELEKLVLSRRIAHGGNPVLRWMVSNVTVSQDPAGNLKPDKGRSSEKIDGVVALIMALGRAMVQPAEPVSVYETRGVLAFG